MNDKKAESELKTLYQITENAADINTILINRGEFRNLRARVAELEAQLESIGAGGVGPLIPATVQHQHKLSSDNDLQRENGHLSTTISSVPPGWKLVPVEPTQAMMDAMQSSGWLPGCYRAMLAAAPQPPAPGCKATKRGEHVVCDDCKSVWEASDKNPPACVPAPPAVEQPQGEQEPIRWPANASEVRAFLSGHVAAERYARDDCQPDDSDTYTLSAHDLLGAIDWWTDFAQRPQQPLPPDVSGVDGVNARLHFRRGWKSAERAHGIGGDA